MRLHTFTAKCPECGSKITIEVHPGYLETKDSPAEGPEIWTVDGCKCGVSDERLFDLISEQGEGGDDGA